MARLAILSKPIRYLCSLLHGGQSLKPFIVPTPTEVMKATTISIDSSQRTEACPTRDADYYMDEYQGGFCVFQVENALFRVHRFILARDSSVFETLFTLPKPQSSPDGRSDDDPVFLTDTVEQFRDLLWALYALPADLQTSERSLPSLPINRLLNVAEMANKYGFASFESWALDRIFSLSLDPSGPLHTGSSLLCAQVLRVALLTCHSKLTNIATSIIITRLLREHITPSPILLVAEKHGLRKLQGVACYRQLIDLEDGYRPSPEMGSSTPYPVLSTEKRLQFLSAYHSLVHLWEHLRFNPPAFDSDSCDCHSQCIATWRGMWLNATLKVEMLHKTSADVLGKMQCVDQYLRKSIMQSSLPLECALAALESVSAKVDGIMESLVDHFEYPSC